jgi:serine/threonine protein kinase
MILSVGDGFDHYLIHGCVTQGTTCAVYQASDVLTGKQVALKIPLRSATLDAGRYEQFLREIDALHALNPSCCTAFD